MKYNRVQFLPATAQTAGTTQSVQLGVNPLSHLVWTTRFLNVTDEGTLAEILARFTLFEVLHDGAAIVSISGDDLFRLNMHMFGNTPLVSGQVATDNAARWVSFIIPFGRSLYNPKECIPVTRSGQLTARLTSSATETAVDTMINICEGVELLGASPARTLKYTTLTPTIAATGDNDIDLPREGLLSSLLIFGTTVPTGTAYTKSINSIKLMVDEEEEIISLGAWESMRGEHAWRFGQEKGAVTADGATNDDNYIFADLSPTGSDDFLLDTAAVKSLKLRDNAGDTNAIRIIPSRLIAASRFQG